MSDRKQAAAARVRKSAQSASDLARQLANDDAFADAVSDVVADINSPAFKQAMKDPKGFFESRKVILPKNARVAMRDVVDSVSFEVCVFDHCVTITIEYHHSE